MSSEAKDMQLDPSAQSSAAAAADTAATADTPATTGVDTINQVREVLVRPAQTLIDRYFVDERIVQVAEVSTEAAVDAKVFQETEVNNLLERINVGWADSKPILQEYPEEGGRNGKRTALPPNRQEAITQVQCVIVEWEISDDNIWHLAKSKNKAAHAVIQTQLCDHVACFLRLDREMIAAGKPSLFDISANIIKSALAPSYSWANSPTNINRIRSIARMPQELLLKYVAQDVLQGTRKFSSKNLHDSKLTTTYLNKWKPRDKELGYMLLDRVLSTMAESKETPRFLVFGQLPALVRTFEPRFVQVARVRAAPACREDPEATKEAEEQIIDGKLDGCPDDIFGHLPEGASTVEVEGLFAEWERRKEQDPGHLGLTTLAPLASVKRPLQKKKAQEKFTNINNDHLAFELHRPEITLFPPNSTPRAFLETQVMALTAACPATTRILFLSLGAPVTHLPHIADLNNLHAAANGRKSCPPTPTTSAKFCNLLALSPFQHRKADIQNQEINPSIKTSFRHTSNNPTTFVCGVNQDKAFNNISFHDSNFFLKGSNIVIGRNAGNREDGTNIFSPQVVLEIIMRYSTAGDMVIDFTPGSSSASLICALSGRHYHGSSPTDTGYKAELISEIREFEENNVQWGTMVKSIIGKTVGIVLAKKLGLGSCLTSGTQSKKGKERAEDIGVDDSSASDGNEGLHTGEAPVPSYLPTSSSSSSSSSKDAHLEDSPPKINGDDVPSSLAPQQSMFHKENGKVMPTKKERPQVKRSGRHAMPKNLQDFVSPAPPERHAEFVPAKSAAQQDGAKKRRLNLSRRDDETEEQHQMRVKLHKAEMRKRLVEKKRAAKRGE
ncbi:hypothetical protein HK097_000595 [Rhizophlyctis rosea]|uniref:Uncharacterized protein n=1 Tax=Rhizophlyctis rosea TaxID=64517 RepID=A0AAD5S5E4_9FUNG|nr:hypothetical protein HK097_000595 [Rhizophlyctis rosea]